MNERTQELLPRLQAIVDDSERIVFFGGAGVSTESGISDFRSEDGLYRQSFDEPPEYLLSHDCFVRQPETFFRFYRERMLCPDARPNPAHLTLADWERRGRLTAVVTQNIDGLHQMAGSEKVYELHGSVYRNHCLRCGRFYSLREVAEGRGIPRCACGGVIKPDVVLYGEALPADAWQGAEEAIAAADLLLVAGTSLAVYPAASLVSGFRGRHLVIVNRTPTPADRAAELTVPGSVGEILKKIRVESLAKISRR